MHADAVMQVAVPVQEPTRLLGQQPRQLGRIAAQQHRLAEGTLGAGGVDALAELEEVLDVVADDGGGVSLLPDCLQQHRQVGVGAERVDDEVARFAVGLDRASSDLERRAPVAPGAV